MGSIFISPLSWGLGHASRDVPIIRELLSHGHEVTIGTSGNALAFLKKEFPECSFIVFEDYPVPQNNGRIFLEMLAANQKITVIQKNHHSHLFLHKILFYLSRMQMMNSR
jgi:UDP:flavonoid glycosyltransferase YjiC (YdhE family)